MASVDKLFGTIEEYDELYAWCQTNIPMALKYFSLRKDVANGRSMTLFPESIDMVILEFCPFENILKQIRYQYDIDPPPKG